MTDARFGKLAKLLIEYSTKLKRGERVLIEVIDVPEEVSVELMRAARKVGAFQQREKIFLFQGHKLAESVAKLRALTCKFHHVRAIVFDS